MLIKYASIVLEFCYQICLEKLCETRRQFIISFVSFFVVLYLSPRYEVGLLYIFTGKEEAEQFLQVHKFPHEWRKIKFKVYNLISSVEKKIKMIYYVWRIWNDCISIIMLNF